MAEPRAINLGGCSPGKRHLCVVINVMGYVECPSYVAYVIIRNEKHVVELGGW